MKGRVGKSGAVAGGSAAFAELLRAPEESRHDLLERAIDEDARGLVAEALHVCTQGPVEHVLLAVWVLDQALLKEECPELVPDAARVLTELCHPGQDPVVLAAALGVFGVYASGPAAAQTLLGMTAHEVPAVRAAAVDGIEYFTDEGSFPQTTMRLVERLTRMVTEDPDAEVRLAAAGAFTLMDGWDGYETTGTPAVVAALGRAMRTGEDPRVRGEAVHNLALFTVEGHQAAMVADALRPYTHDRDDRVAAWALARLASLGDERAAERLLAVLEATDVHREYVSAATEMSVPYRNGPSALRKRVRKALKRLRKEGWSQHPSERPPMSPEDRRRYLDLEISRLPRW
ncbi:HEAT repeat domain-containing protein [Thermomonospora cellulosilytica]|uniref:HEAT repeat protein n=1 Tax=Thermomonospora cellulosilytica TaxID=1411118 RepID=A0A7W3R6G4_9ACTN|nr:HEAT repeat domain-containing protein [Thermomonospora cellulosilytica]MBA9001501.1 HEAT repeat protein [Thermomonospora cellulosilytica]